MDKDRGRDRGREKGIKTRGEIETGGGTIRRFKVIFLQTHIQWK